MRSFDLAAIDHSIAEAEYRIGHSKSIYAKNDAKKWLSRLKKKRNRMIYLEKIKKTY